MSLPEGPTSPFSTPCLLSRSLPGGGSDQPSKSPERRAGRRAAEDRPSHPALHSGPDPRRPLPRRGPQGTHTSARSILEQTRDYNLLAAPAIRYKHTDTLSVNTFHYMVFFLFHFLKNFIYLFIFKIFTFWPCHTACGILVPRTRDLTRAPCSWKRGVSTAGSPGTSFFTFYYRNFQTFPQTERTVR